METIENNNLSQLVVKLKTKDSNYAKLSKAVQILYWFFIPLFVFISGMEYLETKKINVLVSGVCFILSFIVLALFFRKFYKEYKYVDYSLPTIQMLKKAVQRYQPFHGNSIWIVLGLVLMDIGLTFKWTGLGISITIVQAFFGGTILIGVIIGLIFWYFKYKPIRDEALQLIKEIEAE